MTVLSLAVSASLSCPAHTNDEFSIKYRRKMSVVEYQKEVIVTNDGLGKRFDLPLLHNAIAVSQSNMTRVSIISLIDGGKRKAEGWRRPEWCRRMINISILFHEKRIVIRRARSAKWQRLVASSPVRFITLVSSVWRCSCWQRTRLNVPGGGTISSARETLNEAKTPPLAERLYRSWG